MSDARTRFTQLLAQIRENTIASDALIAKILRANEERRAQYALLDGLQPADPGRPNGHLR